MGVLFCVEVREGFPEKVAFEERHEEGKRGEHGCAEIWGEWVSGEGNVVQRP